MITIRLKELNGLQDYEKLSSIENIWGIVKEKLQKRKQRYWAEVIKNAREICNTLNRKFNWLNDRKISWLDQI